MTRDGTPVYSLVTQGPGGAVQSLLFWDELEACVEAVYEMMEWLGRNPVRNPPPELLEFLGLVRLRDFRAAYKAIRALRASPAMEQAVPVIKINEVHPLPQAFHPDRGLLSSAARELLEGYLITEPVEAREPP